MLHEPIAPEVEEDPRDTVYGAKRRDGDRVLRTRVPGLVRWHLTHPAILVAAGIVVSALVAGFVVSVMNTEVLPTLRHGSLHDQRGEFAAVVETAWESDPDAEDRAIIEQAVSDALTAEDARSLNEATETVRATYED
jgi:hypothetical protein